MEQNKYTFMAAGKMVEGQSLGMEPSIFDGRLVVEIETWEADLHVGLGTATAAQSQRVQGGLSISRGFNIDGRVLGPDALRGKRVRIWLSPFGADMQFGPGGLDEVGQVYFRQPASHEPELSGTLLIPESSLPLVAVCLRSVWKYIQVFTFNEAAERASVSAFGFDAKIHKGLAAKDEQA